jgi:hypothetical protein
MMNFLANTNVLMVDLCKCRGSDPDMVALISSYIFGESPSGPFRILAEEAQIALAGQL